MKNTTLAAVSLPNSSSDEWVEEIRRQYNLSEKAYFRLKQKYYGFDLREALRLENKRSPSARKVEEFLLEHFGEEQAIKIKTRLGKLRKQVLVLSRPIGWFGLILRPVLIFFGIRVFWYFQSFLSRIEKRRFNWTLPPDQEKIAKRAIQDLETDGIACWPGLFASKEILGTAQSDAAALIQKAYTILGNFPGGIGDVRDPEAGHRFLRNGPLKDMGRTRVRLDGWSGAAHDEKSPEWIKRICNEPRFLQVARNRFGVKVDVKRCSIDESIPSLYPVAWHLDTVFDSVKAMILLTDCEPENGAIQYRSRKPSVEDHGDQTNLFLYV